MSNASFKDQLRAVASQFSETSADGHPKTKKKSSTMSARHQPEKKKPKPRWLDYAHYGVELLKAYFPAAFKDANEVMPLKKGIKQDLVKRLASLDTIVMDDKACMVKSLSYYVNTGAYLKSVIDGRDRVDLDGQPVDKVTLEEANYSQERFKAKQQARQATSNETKPSKATASTESS